MLAVSCGPAWCMRVGRKIRRFWIHALVVMVSFPPEPVYQLSEPLLLRLDWILSFKKLLLLIKWLE